MNTSEIDRLIAQFAKLPGLGPRSARRLVLHLMRHKDTLLTPLTGAMQALADHIVTCSACGNLDASDPCHICASSKRDPGVICIVEDIPDLWAIERCHVFRGHYHVLGGTLSVIDGRGPEALKVDRLIARAATDEVREIIIATNATVEGQTTAHYLTDRLKECGVSISRLAQGIPVGGELDYLDEGTLGAAMNARLPF